MHSTVVYLLLSGVFILQDFDLSFIDKSLCFPKFASDRFRQGQELDSQGSMGSECEVPLRKSFSINSQSAVRRGWEKSSRGFFRLGQSLKFRNSARVFDEAVAKQENQNYLDPSSPSLHRWNTFFVASCLVAVFVDPLFFYLPVVDNSLNCIKISAKLKISVTVFRTTTDFLYLVHMFLQFRTAYIAPSSRVFGRGALETNLKKIGARYMRKDFWLDFVAVLPIPQVPVFSHQPLKYFPVHFSHVLLLNRHSCSPFCIRLACPSRT